MNNKNIRVYPNQHALSIAAADYIIKLARKMIGTKGYFSAALSGGGTPKPVYKVLASAEWRDKLDWEKVHLFWGDERCVPLDHSDSNYHMARQALFQYISIPAENIHPVPAEMDPISAASAYEKTLRGFFKESWPHFDLVLLGMGKDGHTASLFPHSEGLNEEDRWFIANYAPVRETWRLTLTKNAINAAGRIVVLVSGDLKADMLYDVLEGAHKPDEKPIQLITPAGGKMIWIVDQAAAVRLSG